MTACTSFELSHPSEFRLSDPPHFLTNKIMEEWGRFGAANLQIFKKAQS